MRKGETSYLLSLSSTIRLKKYTIEVQTLDYHQNLSIVENVFQQIIDCQYQKNLFKLTAHQKKNHFLYDCQINYSSNENLDNLCQKMPTLSLNLNKQPFFPLFVSQSEKKVHVLQIQTPKLELSTQYDILQNQKISSPLEIMWKSESIQNVFEKHLETHSQNLSYLLKQNQRENIKDEGLNFIYKKYIQQLIDKYSSRKNDQ